MSWSCAQVLATNGPNWLLSSQIRSTQSKRLWDEGISENFDLCRVGLCTKSPFCTKSQNSAQKVPVGWYRPNILTLLSFVL